MFALNTEESIRTNAMLKVDMGFVKIFHVFAELGKERSVFLPNAAFTTISASKAARGNILGRDASWVLTGWTVIVAFTVASFMRVVFAFS